MLNMYHDFSFFLETVFVRYLTVHFSYLYVLLIALHSAAAQHFAVKLSLLSVELTQFLENPFFPESPEVPEIIMFCEKKDPRGNVWKKANYFSLSLLSHSPFQRFQIWQVKGRQNSWKQPQRLWEGGWPT